MREMNFLVGTKIMHDFCKWGIISKFHKETYNCKGLEKKMMTRV